MEMETSDESRRQSSVGFKEVDVTEPSSPSPKVPKKFINNWRQACDRTKDRTKELLKKWRTVPEPGQIEGNPPSTPVDLAPCNNNNNNNNNTKWSEHVWATWVKRNTSADAASDFESHFEMTEIQRKKLSHFFISYLDLDRDDFISLADFDAFAERLRHFSDWSTNSPEYQRLKEVQRGFIQPFLLPDDFEGNCSYEALERKIKKEQLSLEQWLGKWTVILSRCRSFHELPLWLQYLPKILFHVINRSGTGKITKEELSAFFSSLLSLTVTQLGPFVNEAFGALTSNDQHDLTYSIYRLCFANFIFGRHPNGPGQYVFGPMSGVEICCFPVDYKMFICSPQDLEHYDPTVKSNRTSIIV